MKAKITIECEHQGDKLVVVQEEFADEYEVGQCPEPDELVLANAAKALRRFLDRPVTVEFKEHPQNA